MIYLDNAATTKLSSKALEQMMPYLTEQYGNPGTVYNHGAKAKKALNQAKRSIAEILEASMEEIVITSSGTESDNFAIKGAAYANKAKGMHIITTNIEHHAVLNTCRFLEKQGFEVTYVKADAKGLVSVEEIRRAIRPDTILISVMFANNEVGTLQPIEEIGKLAGERGILFHTDAVQAFGQVPVSVRKMNIDLLSASGHKFHGPKGSGFLYVKKGVKLEQLLHGGSQESGSRAGTENVPGAVGMAVAAQECIENLSRATEKKLQMRNYLAKRLVEEIPFCKINGSMEHRLAGNLHVSIPGIEVESALIMLDMKGICASGGSACTTGEKEPSHVLMAMGAEMIEAKGSLRLTLSGDNTMEEMDAVADAVRDISEKLRSMSDEYLRYKKEIEKMQAEG